MSVVEIVRAAIENPPSPATKPLKFTPVQSGQHLLIGLEYFGPGTSLDLEVELTLVGASMARGMPLTYNPVWEGTAYHRMKFPRGGKGHARVGLLHRQPNGEITALSLIVADKQSTGELVATPLPTQVAGPLRITFALRVLDFDRREVIGIASFSMGLDGIREEKP